MFAVVEIGKTQVKVAEGDTIDAQRVKGEAGETLTLDKVLMFAKGSDIRVGQPYLEDVKITAKIVNHYSASKVIAYKYRRRKDSATKRGHRQKCTALSITKISA